MHKKMIVKALYQLPKIPLRGQLLDIEFPEGFKKPRQFANHLATAIGIVIRHNPDLDCISHWNEIPENEKLPIYAGLDTWFIIKEWWTNSVVKMYMEEMFQRGRLSQSHKRMVEAGEDPRARSPFDWISLQKWRVICNYYESDKFKKRSATNVSNRKCLPYTHTSGSKSFHTRLLQMENQSYVDNFARTHMKNGTFVNDKAARKHIEMENLRNESIEDREGLTSEREIVKKVLGQRSGYENCAF